MQLQLVSQGEETRTTTITEERRIKEKDYYTTHREERNAYSRIYYAAHLEERRAYSRTYYIKHLEEKRAYARIYGRSHNAANREKKNAYNAAHREKRREYEKRRLYGISRVEFMALFEKQVYRCAICYTDKFGPKGPMIDHDHSTGKIRGILCKNCNITLGLMNDSVVLLRKAIEYLEMR